MSAFLQNRKNYVAKIWLEMVLKHTFMSRKFDAPPSIKRS